MIRVDKTLAHLMSILNDSHSDVKEMARKLESELLNPVMSGSKTRDKLVDACHRHKQRLDNTIYELQRIFQR